MILIIQDGGDMSRRPYSKKYYWKATHYKEWLPDISAEHNPGFTKVINLIADHDGYKSYPKLEEIKDSSPVCRFFQTNSLNVNKNNYKTILYSGHLIYFNHEDHLYVYDLKSEKKDMLFQERPDLKAKAFCLSSPFLIIGHLTEGLSYNPYKIAWSGADIIDYIDGGIEILSDSQEFDPAYGVVQAITRQPNSYIFQEKSIHSYRFEGSPYLFSFSQLTKDIGLYAPQAYVETEQSVYFLSHDGFYQLKRGKLSQIGRRKVDNFFFNDLDQSQKNKISAYFDKKNDCICWHYISKDASELKKNRIISYHLPTKKWGYAQLKADIQFETNNTLFFINDHKLLGFSLEKLPSFFQTGLFSCGYEKHYIHKIGLKASQKEALKKISLNSEEISLSNEDLFCQSFGHKHQIDGFFKTQVRGIQDIKVKWSYGGKR